MELIIEKADKISGKISVPGDKSVSHRSIMLGSLANGVTYIKGFLAADDCISTMRCFRQLGVEIEQISETELRINNNTDNDIHNRLKEPNNILDVGNSGTTLRILPGILAGQEIFSVLTGDASIRRRPTERVVEPLRAMGAQIWGREDGKFAPLAIKGSHLKGIEHRIKVASAQVKTCLMLAGLMAEGTTTIIEPSKSRDHTERMLKLFGADILVEGNTYKIKGGQKLEGQIVDIPGDISSAAFFIIASLLVPSSTLEIKNVGVNETRTGILDALKEMNADIQIVNKKEISNEERADIIIKTSNLTATEIQGEIIPRLIDEIPIIAVAATQANGQTIIKDAKELRIKESDRIAALSIELRKMGAKIEELEDGMIINGPIKLKGARVNSHGDHRIAMSLAIAGLIAEGKTIIEDSECISISYPQFESTLKSII